MISKSENITLLPWTRDKMIGIVMFLAILTLTGGCSTVPPVAEPPPSAPEAKRNSSKINITDACSIVENKSDWYESMNRSFRKWGIPVHVQMAIIHQESKFTADARPPRSKLFWFLPGSRPSTAFGYAQALNGTWEQYQRQTKNHRADRDNFDDAVDFIGWYGNLSYKKLHISKWDAKSQYLAYHEGHGGYERKTYRKKEWLVKVAHKVEANAKRYNEQLVSCQKTVSNSWFF